LIKRVVVKTSVRHRSFNNWSGLPDFSLSTQ